jgi:hypothetical protein
VDEIVVMSVGGVVQFNARGSRLRSGSKGELDGDEKGLSVMLLLIGKVKARGVGDMMDNVGGCGASVVTSSEREWVRWAGMIENNREVMVVSKLDS